MEDFPNDYSNPNAVAGEFQWIRNRLRALEKQIKTNRLDNLWGFGAILAMVLSWSKNGSILYCIGHGIASWIYVVYYAFTRH